MHSPNYLIQSSVFTKTVLNDISEIQKDIIYFLQTQINFREENPTGEVNFDYKSFLAYKNVDRSMTYSPVEIFHFCNKLREINGVIYNIQTKDIEFFNIIDKIKLNESNPESFTVVFASWGKIFFYEKFAKEYAKQSKIQYTQIEKNIIDLKGDKRKKLFELLSMYKETGLYRVSVKELKTLLGFMIFDSPNLDDVPTGVREEKQLKLFFEDREPKKEILKRWAEFKRVFLDPAINDFNSNSKLDIRNIKYEVRKMGTKITGIDFKFEKRLQIELLSEEQKTSLKFFTSIGLTEKQVIFLFQRIGLEEMHVRFNNELTFNNHYENKESKYFRQKSWFRTSTREEIKNVAGFLYENVFTELKNT